MSDEVERLRAAIERIMNQGRAEGIETNGPLGLWLEAQVGALEGLAAILDGQSESLNRTLAAIEAGNKVEMAKLASAIALAGETIRQADLAVKQARNAQLAATVQQENAVQRMIKETLPMFAESLKGALVIREARWNRRKARLGYGLSGLAFLTVFVAGFGLDIWSNWDRLAAYDRCLASSIASGGHIYCRLDYVTPVQPAQQAKQPDGSN